MPSRTGFVCPVLVCLLATPAGAIPRYKKPTEVQVKPIHAHRARTAKPAEPRPSGPRLTVDQFRSTARARVARLNDQAIETLKRLIRVTKDSDPEKPDLLFRLAEHYRDKKVYHMFAARGLDEPIFRASSASKRNRLKQRRQSHEREERHWLLEAIRVYLKVATHPPFAHYKRMDRVLFNLAEMLASSGRRDRALLFFQRLIRSHPKSRYIPDAYLSFAEHYFNAGKVEQALRLYEQVGRFRDSPLYGYALYKQGWCWLNLKDPQRALELFVRVIRDTGRRSTSRRKSRIVLVREAKKDAVRAYSHVGAPQRAWDFFRRIGGSYAPRMLERLAYLYYDQGKYAASILTFRKLMALRPESKDLCRWQHSVLRATLADKDKRQHVVESKRLAAVYDAMKKSGRHAGAAAECGANTSAALRELATTWHRECQVTKNRDTCKLARVLYDEYLARFPGEKDAYRVAFYLAELLYALEAWRPCAGAYTRVVEMRPRGEHLKEAAYAAVLCWKNALDVTRASPAPASSRGGQAASLKPRSIPEAERKMMEAFDTYIRVVPRSKELPSILYQKGRIYYDHNAFGKAAKVFERIVTGFSGHEVAPYAAHLMLDCLNILKRRPELKLWVRRLTKDPHLGKGDFLEQMRRLIFEIQWQEAEEERKAGRFRRCGRLYVELANDHPDSERWAQMLHNAAICFEAAKMLGQAIEIRLKLIKHKPDHRLAKRALLEVGQNYHALAWYSKAAEYYEAFARRFPGEAKAPEALQNAIVFRMGRGEHDRAMADAKLFAKSYGSRPRYASRAAAVNFALGGVHEARGDPAAVVKHYTRYLRRWGQRGGVDRQVRALVTIARTLWKQACPIEGVNGACITIRRERSKRSLRRRDNRRRNKARTHCGPATKMRVTLVKRNPAKVREVRARLAKALELYRRTGAGRGVAASASPQERDKRLLELRFAAAEARFLQAEANLEAFLGITFPRRLDLTSRDPRRAARARRTLARFLKDKDRALGRARALYRQAIKMRVAHWAIAASARIGQLYQSFADALFTAPIPKPRIPHAIAADRRARETFYTAYAERYCADLEKIAIPLETKALQGLNACLRTSTKMSWFNEWSGLCERELNQIQPDVNFMAAEIRAQPGYSACRADRAGLISALK